MLFASVASGVFGPKISTVVGATYGLYTVAVQAERTWSLLALAAIEAGVGVNAAEAIELARTARPDVVLMDIRMPGTGGVTATGQITSQETAGRSPRVLILTTFDLDE